MTEKQYEDVESETWKFENPDDFVCGTLKGIRSEVGQYKQKIYTLQNESGKIINVWGSAVLDTEMSKVEVGDDIKIIYLGEAGENPNYHNFKIQRAKKE